jgi:xylulokinase
VTLVAGVDSSTQSTTIQVRDVDDGRIVAHASAPHPPVAAPRSEQDPRAWWSAFEDAWRAAGEPDVAAIAVAAQQHGLVALDARREVIRPAKLWNDTESAPDTGWLLKQLGGAAAWADAVGSVPLAAFTVTKLSWLHRSEPDAWARLAHVVLPHDWMTMRLCGDSLAGPVTDRGDASGTGYWSPTAGEYRWDLLAIVDTNRDWSSTVPDVVPAGRVVGEWRRAAVVAGTGDNMASAIGLGLHGADARSSGTAGMSIGTSGTVFARSATTIADPSGAVAGFADAEDASLPLVCTLNAARVLDSIARLLGVDLAVLDALALAADAGAGGLTLLPYLDGERTPNLPKAAGALAGMRSDVTRESLARAAVEGVACGLLEAVDRLRQHVGIDELVLTGGGTRSSALLTTIAALADVDVGVAVGTADAVAAGACALAATAAGGGTLREISDRWDLARREPVDVARSPEADEVRERHRSLRDQLHPAG